MTPHDKQHNWNLPLTLFLIVLPFIIEEARRKSLSLQQRRSPLGLRDNDATAQGLWKSTKKEKEYSLFGSFARLHLRYDFDDSCNPVESIHYVSIRNPCAPFRYCGLIDSLPPALGSGTKRRRTRPREWSSIKHDPFVILGYFQC